ncbi:outer membrane lipoprotein-sorting protein [Marinobacter halotolerans]|uniref:outer membrane lipoprotein-sorting protein n=1 Tax=Marinobacter halotolerans TaxID=1569211 RepID=UPI00177DF6C8|nr:outer membrane lipoprotein-sorting protein [Marinobacter halotolerans]
MNDSPRSKCALPARTKTERFFWNITRKPRLVTLVSILLLLVMAAGLMNLVKDTSVKAFIPSDHPSRITDRNITDTFGLTDTVAVAMISRDGSTVFTPQALATQKQLAERIADLENIREDRVNSLATKSSIRGDNGAVLVDEYIPYGSLSDADARDAQARWQNMPQHQGTLVNSDGTAAIVMAEMLDIYQAKATYDAIQFIIGDLEVPGFEFHVAGPGAVSGLMSAYIDQDARRMQPFVFVLVVSFIFIAFRRFGALPGPVFVVLGATGGAMGLMAWLGVPYYAITNALPVIIIAIAVADTIHILSAYYQRQARAPEAPTRELVIGAMVEMLRPVTLTTLTTIAGFIGIAAVSIMPPITAFAWFAALGVFLAWLFSVLTLPNLLVLMKPAPSPSFRNWTQNRPSGTGRLLGQCGALAAKNPVAVIGVFLIMAVVAVNGALKVTFDRSQVDNFKADADIRIADEVINNTFAGTAFLNIMVEADQADGLINVQRMQKIIDLQQFAERQPHVQKTVAITDYISQLHKAIETLPASEERLLPESDNAIAQYLLIYEVSGDPTELEEDIDTLYQKALVRVALNEPHFSKNRQTVEAIQQYIDTQFNEPGFTASLGGDVNTTYHWMKSLQESHLTGVTVSLLLVFLAATFMFRSLGAGLVSVLPVCFALLVLYACMGYTGVYLEPATSMFAAIALGVGVDFAIHLVDKLKEALRMHNGDITAAVDQALPPVARACFFNSAALGLGFAVLTLSELPTLQRFGGLIAVATFTSFLAALLLVPALFAAVSSARRSSYVAAATAAIMAAVIGFIAYPNNASAAEAYDGATIAQKVADRKEGPAARRILDITLTDRRDQVRERQALVLKLNQDEARLTRITYLEPRSVEGVSFLSHDFHKAATEDDRWLFVPATRRARRLPASARGDYFLGTDFTYEDIQSELKFNMNDYHFEYQGVETLEGRELQVISGKPRTEDIARQLGYGAFKARVDESNWMPVTVEFSDPDLEALKTIRVHQVETIDGIVTATRIEAINHQTGHSTVFALRDASHPDTLPGNIFQPSGLTRGLPSSVLK